jgi:hypothetical protein
MGTGFFLLDFGGSFRAVGSAAGGRLFSAAGSTDTCSIGTGCFSNDAARLLTAREN